MDIYVGNLPYEIDDDTLMEAFGEYGQVEKVNIIMDRFTGQAKGFAFVSMGDWKEGQAAIKGLDGATVGGRPIKVNQARQRNDQGPRKGGGFRR